VYRREVMHTPLRTLAEEIGISKSGLDQFYKQSSYPGKVWPKLREWYVKDRTKHRPPPRDTPDELISLMPLFGGIPLEELPDAMRETTASLRHSYESRRLPVPGWIGGISGWADYFEEQGKDEKN
jgi:hypothetical protein